MEGVNLFLDLDGKPDRYGFYTTRFLEAASPDDAEARAIELILNDTELHAALENDPTDPPSILIDSIEELTTFPDISIPGSGYTFFQDDETTQ